MTTLRAALSARGLDLAGTLRLWVFHPCQGQRAVARTTVNAPLSASAATAPPTTAFERAAFAVGCNGDDDADDGVDTYTASILRQSTLGNGSTVKPAKRAERTLRFVDLDWDSILSKLEVHAEGVAEGEAVLRKARAALAAPTPRLGRRTGRTDAGRRVRTHAGVQCRVRET